MASQGQGDVIMKSKCHLETSPEERIELHSFLFSTLALIFMFCCFAFLSACVLVPYTGVGLN